MGIKQFNADVRAAIDAASSLFPWVSKLRKGDSDGEIAFTYHYLTEDELISIDIQALSTEPEAYPRHSGFLIFTSSTPEGPVDLERWLQEISASTKGNSVTDVVALISKTLAAKLKSSDQSEADCISSDDESAFDDNEESFYDAEFDDEMDIDTPPSRGPLLYNQPPSATTTPISRLKRHLREARREGLHVWIPTEGRGLEVFHIFSLSIHASQLNIPEEALGAWGLKPSEYVVMLFRLPSGYPSLSTFLQLPSDQTTVQFRVGKCIDPNPSYASATQVFEHDHSERSGEAFQSKDESKSPFLSLYMSLSLNTLLNKEFPRLLQLRRSEGISWDQAQELHFKLGRGNHRPSNMLQFANSDVSQDPDKSSDQFELEFLQRDYVPRDGEDINVVLTAMQFGLQRLVKCTKYCLVCHQRIEGGFEAIKPFVCEDSLCLFQYLSLGFCQSIEHEIINSPNVVDLLISFFYAATTSDPPREFPKGLGLKCTTSGFLPSGIQPIEAEVCFESNSIRFRTLDYAQYRSIKEGKYITFVHVTPGLTVQEPIMQARK
jgi:ubiquitin-conjugating enzyme E2 Q